MSRRESAIIIVILILAWAAIDGINHLIFHRVADMYFYTLLDLAFLPIEVALLYFVVDRLLAKREQAGRRHKLNMVIGAFFSETGHPLLCLLTDMAVNREEAAAHLAVAPDWDEARLKEALRWVEKASLRMEADAPRLAALRDLLTREREFLLRLLENPTLLEHERFTDLLWALSHLQEELAARHSLESASAADLAHLAADAERAYGRLLAQWLEYMLHLRQFYPYLFSFAARTCPLRADAHAEID